MEDRVGVWNASNDIGVAEAKESDFLGGAGKLNTDQRSHKELSEALRNAGIFYSHLTQLYKAK